MTEEPYLNRRCLRCDTYWFKPSGVETECFNCGAAGTSGYTRTSDGFSMTAGVSLTLCWADAALNRGACAMVAVEPGVDGLGLCQRHIDQIVGERVAA